MSAEVRDVLAEAELALSHGHSLRECENALAYRDRADRLIAVLHERGYEVVTTEEVRPARAVYEALARAEERARDLEAALRRDALVDHDFYGHTVSWNDCGTEPCPTTRALLNADTAPASPPEREPLDVALDALIEASRNISRPYRVTPWSAPLDLSVPKGRIEALDEATDRVARLLADREDAAR